MFYFINKLVILLYIYNTIICVIFARKKTKQQNYVIISKRIETKRNYTIKYKPYVILTLELFLSPILIQQTMILFVHLLI